MSAVTLPSADGDDPATHSVSPSNPTPSAPTSSGQPVPEGRTSDEDRETTWPTTRVVKPSMVDGVTTSSAPDGPILTAPTHGILDSVLRLVCKEVVLPRHNGRPTALHAAEQAATALGAERAVFAQLSKLWDKGLAPITYSFLPGANEGNDVQHQKVAKAIVEWTKYAAVDFKEVTYSQTDKSDLVISFDPADGSWSLIGKDSLRALPKGEASMNLGWVTRDGSETTKEENAVILHEFGHALGMLHEHQSPAHGLQSLEHPELAIKYYSQSQNWNEEEVRQQVINTYNLKDVSNLSKVDRTSIMHYYEPPEIFGGTDSIPYVYYLSDTDKAFMTINYPGKQGSSKEWSAERALQVVGLTPEDPQYKRIISLFQDDARDDGSIDPSNIRNVLTDWTKAQILKTHPELQPSHTLSPAPATVANKDDVKLYWCQNGAKTSSDKPRALRLEPSGDSDKERAVIDRQFLKDFKHLDISKSNGTPNYQLEIFWQLVRDPNTVSTSDPKSKLPIADAAQQAYEHSLVVEATNLWSAAGSLKFTEVTAANKASPDIVIVFQNYDPQKANAEYDLDDEDMRSYTKIGRSMGDPKRSQPAVPHDICIRGAIAAKKALLLNTQSRERINTRSVTHELGHTLGLDHEELGVYGWLVDPTVDKSEEAGRFKRELSEVNSKYLATKFDVGSVMDALREEDEFAMLGSTLRWKVVQQPSEVDLANIALLYPGGRLVTGAAGGADPIDKYANALGIPADTILQLKKDRDTRAWNDLRTHYLIALERLQTDGQKKMVDWWKAAPPAAKSHALNAPAAIMRGLPPPPPASLTTDDTINPLRDFKKLLYDAVKSVLGPADGSASFLTLQIPTRYLEKADYSYQLNGIYSNFIKPAPVNEAEFRLTDSLYDARPIVAGPNGKSLSTVYEQILNSMIPAYDQKSDKSIRQQRERMRNWLLTETSSTNAFFVNEVRLEEPTKDGTGLDEDQAKRSIQANKDESGPRRMTRMEVSETLMQDYYNAQIAWEQKKSTLIADAIEKRDQNELQRVTRELVHITQAEVAKVSAKYDDAVVRGYYHVVRECMGELDIKSTAEFLIDAKDSFRESAMSSLYGASRVLPVLMTPGDWSEALDTSFAPEDLSNDPAVLESSITAKATQIDTLRDQLSTLQHNVQGDEKTLKEEVDVAADAYAQAEANASSKYGAAAMSLAKIIISRVAPGASVAVKAAAATTEESSNLSSLLGQFNPMATVDEIFGEMGQIDDAQRKLKQANAKYTSLLTDYAAARATNTIDQQGMLERQIAAATLELQDLQNRLVTARLGKHKADALTDKLCGNGTSVANETAMNDPAGGKDLNLPKVDDLAASATTTAGGSRWMKVIVDTNSAKKDDASASSASASQSSWHCNFWLGGGGGSDSTANANSQASSTASNLNVEVQMQVTLVTVDRSSWFQPQFFDMAASFMQASSNKDSRWNEYPQGVTTNIAAVKRATDLSQDFPTSLLPCFTTGFILCKDVVIKVSGMTIKTSDEKRFYEHKSESSGGFLCFSYSHGSQDSNQSATASFSMAQDGMVIRIPGPQILGYVQQMLPPDTLQPYDPEKALRPDFDLPDESGAATTASTAEKSHGLQDTRQNDIWPLRSKNKPTNASEASPAAHAAAAPPGASEPQAAAGLMPNGIELPKEALDSIGAKIAEILTAKLTGHST